MLEISHFYTFIIPLAKVEKYYPDGVEAFKRSDETREYYSDPNSYLFDDFLCAYVDMGSGIDGVIEFWKSLGAVDTVEENGEWKFHDFLWRMSRSAHYTFQQGMTKTLANYNEENIHTKINQKYVQKQSRQLPPENSV
ncbi:MAG: hypothetical protein LBS25_09315 [Candidatus Symbiothrix sp.]|jgi:hypothetical protein|nr:hypothetical protein [Candidatus Symbiothrix sp.]